MKIDSHSVNKERKWADIFSWFPSWWKIIKNSGNKKRNWTKICIYYIQIYIFSRFPSWWTSGSVPGQSCHFPGRPLLLPRKRCFWTRLFVCWNCLLTSENVHFTFWTLISPHFCPFPAFIWWVPLRSSHIFFEKLDRRKNLFRICKSHRGTDYQNHSYRSSKSGQGGKSGLVPKNRGAGWGKPQQLRSCRFDEASPHTRWSFDTFTRVRSIQRATGHRQF